MTRVLVIDDDKSICMSLETWLRQQKCAATLANSGRLGVETFESHPFDLVMVDIFMPGMDGIETIKHFRERAPAVPIIAMTGFRFRDSSKDKAPDFLGMAAKLGATYCLRKPFGPQQLSTAVNACFGERAGHDHPDEGRAA